MGDMMNGNVNGSAFLLTLLVLALLVLAVTGTVWLIRSMISSGGRTPASPEHELGRRYAAGEIDRDQFLRSSDDLVGRRRSDPRQG